MTPVEQLVSRLRARGIVLRADGGTLVVRPRSAVNPDEVEALKVFKPEVLALLRGHDGKPVKAEPSLGPQIRAIAERLKAEAAARRNGAAKATERWAPAAGPTEELTAPLPSPPAPISGLIDEYRAVLAQLWALNGESGDRSPEAPAANVARAQRLLDEQARLADDLGAEFAAAVAREHAKTWARVWRACPWCGTPDVFHATDEDRAPE